MKTESPQVLDGATLGPVTEGVTVMQANFRDHAFERHSHDCYAIGATTHGIQRFRCKGRQYDSLAGDFVLFNPDDDHDGRAGTADGFAYTIWYVASDVVAGGPGDAARGRYFSRPHVADAGMAEGFRRLSASLVATPCESLRTGTMLQAFLGAMLERHGERPQSGAAPARDAGAASLARVRDYLRTYYAHDISVSDLAKVAGLSPAHLTRAFGAAYHMPPHVYLNTVRIAQAQARIRVGMPLVTVALECGFADQSHFTRRFKGSVGVTPSAWRRMAAPGVNGRPAAA